ncbi:MAG TPA: hypothetical protein VHI13_15135 [Candidatus Kapabacteria bacterium]|nr:hypothetical protein [Candidatus Kapabacteria bacterium]
MDALFPLAVALTAAGLLIALFRREAARGLRAKPLPVRAESRRSRRS